MTPNTVIRLYNAPQHLQLSATTIRRLIKDGEIKTVSLGKRAKGIMQSEIDAFLERRTNAQ